RKDDVGPALSELFDRAGGVAGERHSVAERLQPGSTEALKRRLVVHEQHVARYLVHRPLLVARGGGGKTSVRQVFQPGRSVSLAQPPCASMILATMARPSPVPFGSRDTKG